MPPGTPLLSHFRRETSLQNLCGGSATQTESEGGCVVITQLPLQAWDVKPVEGAGYVANSICARPECNLIAAERHHLWRRSFLGGDYSYVELPDGAVVGNIVFLCNQHHRQITENRALISFIDGVFYWIDKATEMPLSWQPDFFCTMADFLADRADPGIRDSKPLEEKRAPKPGVCQACGQPLPHRKTKREERKFRKTWSVSVPVDQQENGAEVLDENLEHARQLFAEAGLPYGSVETAKYFVLSTALALFIVNADQILDEGGTE